MVVEGILREVSVESRSFQPTILLEELLVFRISIHSGEALAMNSLKTMLAEADGVVVADGVAVGAVVTLGEGDCAKAPDTENRRYKNRKANTFYFNKPRAMSILRIAES